MITSLLTRQTFTKHVPEIYTMNHIAHSLDCDYVQAKRNFRTQKGRTGQQAWKRHNRLAINEMLSRDMRQVSILTHKFV